MKSRFTWKYTGAFMLVIGLLLSLLPTANAQAPGSTHNKKYPSPTGGPYVMEVSGFIFDPGHGSIWHFGFFTYCNVPHMARHTVYGGVQGDTQTRVYQGSGSFKTTAPNNFVITIDNLNITEFKPQWPGASRSTYLPSYPNPGQPQMVTVISGWSDVRLAGTLQDKLWPYYSVNISSIRQFKCCDACSF